MLSDRWGTLNHCRNAREKKSKPSRTYNQLLLVNQTKKMVVIEKNLPSNEGFDTSARMDFFLIWSLDFLYVANDFPILREIEKDIHLFEYI